MEDFRVQTPVEFPLPSLHSETIRALQKSWSRQNLSMYLKRWDKGYIPAFPKSFWDYGWRACDIGCGYGKFLLQESLDWPGRGYLGIDKGNLRGGVMVKRFEQAGRSNLFAMHGNAIPVLAQMPEYSLDFISFFYPNPWWPKKHCKKRWSYHSILPHLFRLLKPGGKILLCSNESFYLQEWVFTMENHPDASGFEKEYVGQINVKEGRSHFEDKFVRHGVICGEIRYTRSELA